MRIIILTKSIMEIYQKYGILRHAIFVTKEAFEKTVNARARTEQAEFYEGGNLCFCEAETAIAAYRNDKRQISGQGMASLTADR